MTTTIEIRLHASDRPHRTPKLSMLIAKDAAPCRRPPPLPASRSSDATASEPFLVIRRVFNS